MKQFLNVLKFEFSNYSKNKLFVGFTLVVIIFIGLGLSSPRIFSLFKSEETEKPAQVAESKPIIVLSDQVSQNKEQTLKFFQSYIKDKQVVSVDKSIDELQSLVDDSKYSGAIFLKSLTSYTYIVKDKNIYDVTTTQIEEALLNNYRYTTMINAGVSEQNALKSISIPLSGETIKTGTDQIENFLYTYILIFALYTAILLYGQLVASSVVSEKSSKAMEVLVTSAKPTSLMFGKVIGAGLAGLAQMVAVLGSAFLFYNLNSSYWGENQIIQSIFNMPISMLLYTILFFVLGYFMYAFMFGALGSFASKSEDINTLTLPINLLFVAAFLIVMVSMGTGSFDTPLLIASSYIPFTSPMAMFVRIAMSNVNPLEIIGSVAILFLTTLGIGYLAAKIYKMGVLMYGKPPKIKDIIIMMKAKNS